MTSPTIPSRAFDHPAAWTAADLGGKEAFAFDLADRHIAAFEAAVAGLRERGRTAFEISSGSRSRRESRDFGL